MVIFGKVLKSLGDKKLLQCFLSNKKETQKREMGNGDPVAAGFVSRERSLSFSLDLQAI